MTPTQASCKLVPSKAIHYAEAKETFEMTTAFTAIHFTQIETCGTGESVDLLDQYGEQIDSIPVEIADGDFLTRDRVKVLIESTGRTVAFITEGGENGAGLATWSVEV